MAESLHIPLANLRFQVAALPMRHGKDGSPRVLLITSRETGRWVIPKGWPMKGRKFYEAAAREAFEEAGILGDVGKEPLGSYLYHKRQKAGFELCEVTVYLLSFEHQRKVWPEKGQRHTAWFSVSEAAIRVHEPGLSAIIRSLSPTLPAAEDL